MLIMPEGRGSGNDLIDDDILYNDDFPVVPAMVQPLLATNHPDTPFELIHGNPDCDNVWIIAGTAQAQAAAACQPDDVAIYCVDKRNFLNAVRPDGLDAIEDKRVLIFPQGDAAADHYVFDRATAFGRICDDEGATAVLFSWLSADLDAHLGTRDLAQRQKRLLSVAKRTGTKPAKARPKAPSMAQQERETKTAELEMEALETGRPVIDVNDDRLKVLNQLVSALRDGVDGYRLFNLGGKLVCTTTDEKNRLITEIVDDERLLNLLPRCAQTISVTAKGTNHAWPESKTVAALFGRHGDFRPLSRIASSPIVRRDHTIAAEDGYDEASQVLLDLNGLKLDIPDSPTADEVQAAVSLLIDEWLGDFPFVEQADKANTLALILTFPMRELVDLVPLQYILARSKGTGKTKLGSLIVWLFTRSMPDLDSLPENEDEIRKQITTLLSTAPQAMFFDESPKIGGRSINRFLTARRWSDRLLGGNQRAALPNDTVLIATANNGQAVGDTGRRYVPIVLKYDGENPENRPETEFQHPDLESWTEQHRGELLTAVFTIIRAWQVAGRPKRSTSFGSFERWEAVIGGVLANAGVEGFLSNLAGHRESADFDEGLWAAHCEWLARIFPAGMFTASMVVAKMVRSAGPVRTLEPSADLPPWVEGSPLDANYAIKLGRLYNDRHDGWFGGYRITKGRTKTGNKVTWNIETSPRILRERADAAAAQKAAMQTANASKAAASTNAAAAQRGQILADLSASKAKLAELQAKNVGPAETPEIQLLRLTIENAELIAARTNPTTVSDSDNDEAA